MVVVVVDRRHDFSAVLLVDLLVNFRLLCRFFFHLADD